MNNLVYTYKYPRPSVTGDCVVITKETEPRVLLIQRGNEPFKVCWAFIFYPKNLEGTVEEMYLCGELEDAICRRWPKYSSCRE